VPLLELWLWCSRYKTAFSGGAFRPRHRSVGAIRWPIQRSPPSCTTGPRSRST
jgi:hypothetical protein